jgi:hypothetical protein
MLRQSGPDGLWRRSLTAALVAAGLLAVVLAIVVPAQGTPNATIQQRVTALEKKTATLQKNVKDLTAAANVLAGCFVVAAQAVPIGSFGGTATEGYLYRLTNGTQVLASALGVVAAAGVTDTTPHMLVTTRQCATIINGGRLGDLRLPGAGKAGTLRLQRQKRP